MIREGLKGHHHDSQEVVTEIMYWFFAKHFGFTPEQVDNLPHDRATYMMDLQIEATKQENKPK